MPRQTVVSIEGDKFLINGRCTYPGRTWKGHSLEGRLMNSRMVQAIFDDLNTDTRPTFDYPDGPWDAQRNTDEFIAAMPEWKAHGLLGIAFNLQGGSPQGYSKHQPWVNSTFRPNGTLRESYLARLEAILDRADELGMVVILGCFYFGQDEHLNDESAVIDATENATDWLCEKGYTNVIVEIANECDVTQKYEHEIIHPHRVHELIKLVKKRSAGRLDTFVSRLLVGTSFCGGSIPTENVVGTSDVILLHGNGVEDPARIREMVRTVRKMDVYSGQPIVFNEDDHFDFDQQDNNMIAAVSEHAGWGYFDYRFKGEGYDEGYQSVPVNWGISSDRKRGFFGLLKDMTG
ncbi:MAG: hypothetical protein ACLFVU_00205, partial [Phycisphaerae bacterium]